MNCSSENISYVIKCNGCGEDYIGQQIRNPHLRMISLSNHLDKCPKKFQEDPKNWKRI